MRANSYSALCAKGAGTSAVGAPVTGMRARALVSAGRGCSSFARSDWEGDAFGGTSFRRRSALGAFSTVAAADAAGSDSVPALRRCRRPPLLPRFRFGLGGVSVVEAEGPSCDPVGLFGRERPFWVRLPSREDAESSAVEGVSSSARSGAAGEDAGGRLFLRPVGRLIRGI
jgi:hypothetical protein